MNQKKIEVLQIPIFASQLAALKVLSSRRGVSVERLAYEFISAELKLERRLNYLSKKQSSSILQFEPDSEENSRIEQQSSCSEKTDDLLLRCIGMQIKRKRLELGLSQFELGRKSGFSRTLILDIEKGKRAIGLDKIERIAAALDAEGSQLVHFAERICDGIHDGK